MRVHARRIGLVVVLGLCAGCGRPAAPPAPETTTAAVVRTVNPARVERLRGDVPTGYEFTSLPERAAPVALWGFGPQWTADPVACAGLGDPAGGAPVHGWSASGPGGIVYAVVADAPVGLDEALVGSCGVWNLTAGHTTGVVDAVDPPAIDGVATSGMFVDATTAVEGGTETHSHAETFAAYLGDYVAYVTVVTDPGSSGPSLGPGFAPNLLVEAVSTIRG